MSRRSTLEPEHRDCPGDAPLRRLLDGDADSVESAALEDHLAACPDCQARLQRWTGLEPEFRDWLGHAADPPGDVDPAEQAFVARVKAALHESGFAAEPSVDIEVPDDADGGDHPVQIGTYRIERRAGVGGMGTVYEAVDTRLGRRVALKILHPADRNSRPVVDRFEREAAVLAALNHPNIVPVYKVGEHGGRPFLVLEFIPGGTLTRWAGGRPQSPRDAARAVATLSRAVQFAHDHGVIHRDLKPGNILLKPVEARPDAGPGPDALPLAAYRLMIVDFGLARWRHDAPDLTRSNQPIGTPAYMAPEQAAGRSDATGPGIDIHALGAILYELLTGHPPFQAAEIALTLRMIQETEPVAPRRLQPGVPRDLETIALKCLEKDPRRRYATAGALADDLERFLDHRSIVARPVRLPGRLWRWCRRNAALAVLGTLALGLLVALVAGAFAFGVGQSKLRQLADTLRDRAESRERQARQNAIDARSARDLASRHLQQAIQVLTNITNRLWDVGLDGDPRLRVLRDDCYKAQAAWCEEYLAQLTPGAEWDAADVQVALALAWLRTEAGRIEEAESLARRSRAAAERLTAADPGNREVLDILAGAYVNLGGVHYGTNRFAPALAYFDQADRILAAYLRTNPDDIRALHNRFSLYGNTAAALALLGRREEALRAEQAGIATARTLIRLEPGRAERSIQLAFRLGRAGRLLFELGRADEAYDALTESLGRFARAPAGSPRDNEMARARVDTLEFRIRAAVALGHHGPAVADVEELLPLLPPDPRHRLAWRLQLTESLGRSGQPAQALAEAEAVSADPDAVQFYPVELASQFALLAADPTAGPAERDRRAACAVALLEQGRALGGLASPRAVASLIRGSDFDSLRDRPDFRRLLDSLELPTL